MWEAITKALDIVLPSILAELKTLVHSKDQKRRAEFASFVSKLFFSLSEICVQARSIQETLQIYLQRMERHLADNNDPYALTFGNIVQDSIDKQISSLRTFKGLLVNYGRELIVLSVQTYTELRVFADHKTGILLDLNTMLAKGKFPTSQLSIKRMGNGGLETRRHTCEFEHVVSLDKEWDAEVFSSIKRYYESGDIDRRISEMDKLLTDLREQIGKTFSSNDLLVAIQSKGRHAR